MSCSLASFSLFISSCLASEAVAIHATLRAYLVGNETREGYHVENLLLQM